MEQLRERAVEESLHRLPTCGGSVRAHQSHAVGLEDGAHPSRDVGQIPEQLRAQRRRACLRCTAAHAAICAFLRLRGRTTSRGPRGLASAAAPGSRGAARCPLAQQSTAGGGGGGSAGRRCARAAKARGKRVVEKLRGARKLP